MIIRIRGAREHNLKDIDIELGEGLTVVTGVSGSGKTSLVFDTLYHEARRRLLDIYSLGSVGSRLAPADVDSITGLGPAVAVGQNLLNRNPKSTLATACGLHPFLRLLYANFGERTCPNCGTSLAVFTEDEIVERLVSMAEREPLHITTPLVRGISGSHRTLLAALAERFGNQALNVDGAPWDGEPLQAEKKHDIEILLSLLPLPGNNPGIGAIRQMVQHAAALGATAIAVKGETILARAPVCPECGTWFSKLRPVDFHRPCPHCAGQGCSACAGSGLPPQAAAARWAGLRLPGLLALSVEEAGHLFANAGLPSTANRLRTEIERRLQALQRVGLGYLTLDRPSPSLSRGEAQRVRLALTLISRLEDMLHVLDEPTVGQHPSDVQHLLPAFRQLAGPVIFVEHDRTAAAGADRAVDLGPGAGQQGGQVVFQGPPSELWQANTATARYFSRRDRLQQPHLRPAPTRFLTIHAASLRNLQNIDVSIPIGRLTVVTGVSGSGKSTLIEDVLVATLANGTPIGCQEVIGTSIKPVMVDQSPIGRNPRSNPATYTKLADLIRDLFATATGLSPSHFSFNRPEGACSTCGGLGAVEVSMRYLPATWVPCADCGGARFNDDVLASHVLFGSLRLNIAEFYSLPVSQVLPLIKNDEHLAASDRRAAVHILEALCDIGLGYLSLGQPSPTLSGGEAQRVKLARYLGQRHLTGQLLVLDEPSTGLHPQDLTGLLAVLDRLVRAGATVVVVEHNTDMIRAADWVIDLGPGAGPRGGQLLYAGPTAGLTSTPESLTGKALRDEEDLALLPACDEPPSSRSVEEAISIRTARAHNLKDVSVDIPKGKLTVVTGVSGSGKSSLVSDVLEAEARRRYLETLSLYERQSIHEGPEAEVASVSGLGVVLTIAPERFVYSRRATVGTATELSHYLAILLATRGERTCLACGERMERSWISLSGVEDENIQGWRCPGCGSQAPLASSRHFSSSTYAAACLKCNGVGSLQIPQPGKLIIHPEKPLIDGAMFSPGFFPNGYLGKPYNHGYYMVLALGEHYGFDPAVTPWNRMSPEAQQAFLFGSETALTITVHSRNGRSYTHQAKFPGFYGFIRDWDVGGTYTDTVACPECAGARLRPEYLAVKLGAFNIHQLSQMTLIELSSILTRLHESASIETSSQADEKLVAISLQTARQRLRFLIAVGLGYLHLDQVAGTLSAGEVQRIRLASLLGSGLTSLTLLMDEPTRGLHPAEVQALLAALSELRQQGNTLIAVEHDPLVIRAADHLIDVGPLAGAAGGSIVAQGTPEQVLATDTLTALWLRGEKQMPRRLRRQPSGWMVLQGARANNLKGETVRIPRGVLIGVCGVSGSGKSTLVMDTLGRALAPRKQTTSVAYEPVVPGEHDAITGAPARALLVSQARAGVTSPASFLGLTRPLQTLFAASEDAQALGLSVEQLTARCSACGGSGILPLDMAFLPDIHLTCETCQGTGYLPEAWDVRLKGIALPEVFGLTVDEVFALFGDDERLSRPLQAARQVGLGYLVLRQPGYALSGGEAQRLKIAQELCRGASRPRPASTREEKGMASESLYILDEPTIGQHLEDVQRLVGVLHHLVDLGGSVLVVEHHCHLLAACDWLVELGPGGGPQGGWVIAEGTPEQVASANTPIAPYLRQVLEASP